MQAKAGGGDFLGRFREIVSDPINLLIKRDAAAGTVESGMVILHNGNRVPVSGPDAYYERFSDILIINRGVHEPLEEFAFQSLVSHLPAQPFMLELGSYWAHYSMWMAKVRPDAILHLVEPNAANIAVGIRNFERNNCKGRFFEEFVGRGKFEVDRHMAAHGIDRITLLHSDIQGSEAEMLEGAAVALKEQRIDYVFVSTHSQKLHASVENGLSAAGYRIEVSSDFDNHTTSFDGFVMASAPTLPPVLADLPAPFGRQQIASLDARTLASWLDAALARQALHS